VIIKKRTRPPAILRPTGTRKAVEVIREDISTFSSGHDFCFGDREEMGLGIRVATSITFHESSNAMLRDLGDGICQISLLPRSGVNAYFAGGVLFDAGIPSNAKKILSSLKGQQVTEHAWPRCLLPAR
jgi:hypothetical protein